LCTLGSAGDVYPFIGIGQELRKRGYRLTLVTNPFFEAQARDVGLEFVGLGSVGDYLSIIENPDLWHRHKGLKLLAESALLPSMEPLYEIISSFDPSQTVLAAQGQLFGAHMAHEKLGFPFVTIHLQSSTFRSVYDVPLLPAWMPPLLKSGLFSLLDFFVLDRIFAPRINRFRRSLALPAVKKIFASSMHSPQLSLGLFPDWFAPPQPDWPPQAQLTGFVFYDKKNRPEGDSKRLEEFLSSGDTPIIFTPGTAMKHGNQFFAECIAACRLLGRRGILLTQHPDQLPRELPADVQHFDYVPFSKILPRAAAVVHHGGIGTTAQAIAAGIPQVIRPMAYDQPENAIRVERLGIGASLRPKEFNAASLVGKLNRLTSPEVRDRCKSFARKIIPDQAVGDTCAILEEFARNPSRYPVRRPTTA
jgi:rhamnosyltransferase subunit B